MDEQTELTGLCAGCGVAIAVDCSLCDRCERQLLAQQPGWEDQE